MRICLRRRYFLGVMLSSLLATTVHAADEYVFAFPPREKAAAQKDAFEPIAKLLSKAAGKPVRLQFTDNWISYQRDMREGKHDIVFDSPAFTGWRMAKHGFMPLAKLEGQLVFSAISRKDDERIKQVKDLAGRAVCAFPPPNMVTISMLDQFDNPARQPIITNISNFKEAYQNLMSGRCRGVFILSVMADMIDQKHATRTLYQTKPFPQPAISAGPKIPADVRQKMADALLSPEGAQATAKLRAEFGGKNLVAATAKEYEGLGVLLKDMWGMEL